ncbi:MAG: hypothetical protein AB7K09_26240 [Planctomycetota bacterium]
MAMSLDIPLADIGRISNLADVANEVSLEVKRLVGLNGLLVVGWREEHYSRPDARAVYLAVDDPAPTRGCLVSVMPEEEPDPVSTYVTVWGGDPEQMALALAATLVIATRFNSMVVDYGHTWLNTDSATPSSILTALPPRRAFSSFGVACDEFQKLLPLNPSPIDM